MKTCYEKHLRPATMNMVEEDGKIWMALLNRNGICEVDKASRKARIIKIFDGEPLTKKFLYCKVEKMGDYLVFSPWEAENIAVYNMRDRTITYIPLRETEQKVKGTPDGTKFWNMIQYQTRIYLLGYSYPAIVIIDLNSMEAEYITDWVEEVEDNFEVGDSRGYLTDGYVRTGVRVLIPVGCMNAVLELNMETAKTKLHKLNISMKGIVGISSTDGENIWMVGKGEGTSCLCCWNKQNNMIKEMALREEDGDISEPYYAPICGESKIFLIPMGASFFYEMNLDCGRIVEYRSSKIQLRNREPLWPNWRTMAPRLQNGILSFLTCEDLMWHEYNVYKEEHTTYCISFNETEEAEKYFDVIYEEENNCVLEEKTIPLEHYLKRAGRENAQGSDKESKHRLTGSIIYDRICGVSG